MNKAKNKGDRYEREVKKKLQQIGLDVVRVQLPAQAGRQFSGDLILKRGKDIVAEVKFRNDGFKRFYGWLENRDILFAKAKRREWLMVIPEKMWGEFLNTEEKNES